jgi:SAM-dependent methyltransferase
LQLNRLSVLHDLLVPCDVKSLAAKHRLNVSLMSHALEFLARTTEVIIQKRDGRFQLGDTSPIELAFQLEKFVGAYGPALHMLGDAMRHPDAGKIHVDRRALAAAFAGAGSFLTPLVPDLIRKAGVRCLLDLGCGTASLLIELARSDREFRGIGVDASRFMYRHARRTLRENGLGRRIKVKHVDGRDLRGGLSPTEITRIDGLHGRSFLNEFFASGDRDIVEVLRQLRALFPRRKAWFVDYYGRLGHSAGSKDDCQLTLLQDIAQTVSGQGVPPSDAKTWRAIYRKAGSRLKRAYEFQGAGIKWFIHEVEL